MKTESQKIRELIPLTDVELAQFLEHAHIPYDIDSDGAPWLSYQSLVLIEQIMRP